MSRSDSWLVTTNAQDWRNCTSGRKFESRFWIKSPDFLLTFNSNHRSISLTYGDIRVLYTDKRTNWRTDTRIFTIHVHILVGQLMIETHLYAVISSTRTPVWSRMERVCARHAIRSDVFYGRRKYVYVAGLRVWSQKCSYFAPELDGKLICPRIWRHVYLCVHMTNFW